jgi:hypothetical protein
VKVLHEKVPHRPVSQIVVPAIQPLTRNLVGFLNHMDCRLFGQSMPLNLNFQRDILGFVMKGLIAFTMQEPNDDIPSFNIVSCKQFYDGVIAEFIANDDITNPVFMMKDDSALTHLNAPLGYLIKKE